MQHHIYIYINFYSSVTEIYMDIAKIRIKAINVMKLGEREKLSDPNKIVTFEKNHPLIIHVRLLSKKNVYIILYGPMVNYSLFWWTSSISDQQNKHIRFYKTIKGKSTNYCREDYKN